MLPFSLHKFIPSDLWLLISLVASNLWPWQDQQDLIQGLVFEPWHFRMFLDSDLLCSNGELYLCVPWWATVWNTSLLSSLNSWIFLLDCKATTSCLHTTTPQENAYSRSSSFNNSRTLLLLVFYKERSLPSLRRTFVMVYHALGDLFSPYMIYWSLTIDQSWQFNLLFQVISQVHPLVSLLWSRL